MHLDGANFEDSGSRERLLSENSTELESDEEPDQPLEAGAVHKLKCCICMLTLIVVGFVAALHEAKAHYHSSIDADSPSDWVCWVIKCMYLSLAIAAFGYLQRCVILPGKIPRASYWNARCPQKRFTLRNVHRCLEIPKNLANYPSRFFLVIFVIFAVLAILCGVLQTVCEILDSANPSILRLIPYFEIVRCLLLTVFIVMQTVFFVRFNRTCLQWKLNGVWLAMCVIIAVNISAWFFYVELEVMEVMGHHQLCNGTETVNSPSMRTAMESATQTFFPFLIEFFIMGAIIAGSFLSNAGRLPTVLQGSGVMLTPQNIKHLLRPPKSRPYTIRQYCKQQRGSLAFGLSLVLIGLAVSITIKFIGDCTGHDKKVKLTLNYLLAAFYTTGVVCSFLLLRVFKSDRKTGHGSAHLADRLLLWGGALAVMVNEFYRFWSNCTDMNKDSSSRVVTLLDTGLNTCQSVLQVYVLECILVRNLQPTIEVGKTRGKKLLTILMLINAAEWLVSAVAFNKFFAAGSGNDSINTVIAIFTMPLQVFFRFHSIGCIHEFKKHCTEDHEPFEAEEHESIEFPTFNQRTYGSVM